MGKKWEKIGKRSLAAHEYFFKFRMLKPEYLKGSLNFYRDKSTFFGAKHSEFPN